MKRLLTFILATTLGLAVPLTAVADEPDGKTLERAIDYFAGGKYHEALILFTRLDSRYNLNPRFKAYIGVCHYHEWNYEEACRYLDPVIDDLEVYAPHERSVYYLADAESHFQLQQYKEAVPLYERQLLVCYDNEKGDALYRLGFCHMFLSAWQNAVDCFTSAKDYYLRFNPGNDAARLAQIDKMIAGCEAELRKP